jgi:hypothetical protein
MRRTIPARSRRIELTIQDTRWLCSRLTVELANLPAVMELITWEAME